MVIDKRLNGGRDEGDAGLHSSDIRVGENNGQDRDAIR